MKDFYSRCRAALALALTVGFAFAVVLLVSRARSFEPAHGDSVFIDGPIIQLPPTVFASFANLPADTKVIGVSVGGQHRAYVVRALTPINGHVVNDLLAGVPVTVTYCDLADCSFVYRGPGRGKVLDVTVGGKTEKYDGSQLILRVGTARFHQDTGLSLEKGGSPFPYPRIDHERTTWGAWRTEHPDTDVYVGHPFAADKAANRPR